MAQYKTGSVNVTNGSATVTGVDTLWSAEVSAGDIFTIVGDNAWYEVGSVGSNTSITLTSTYAGSTASGAQYAISRDFTTNKSIPYPQKGDIETASLLKRAMNIIDTELSNGFDSSNVTITGGTINGTTIGGTTAAAGAFTTLAASGAVTLSGGTANGVAYLNGSKVLTTGSALTFDGTTLTNTRTSPDFVLNDTSNSNTALRLLSTGGVTYVQSGISGGSFSPIAFTANGGGSEQMRLTSTGLGIGTSSPQTKLQVNGNVYLGGAARNIYADNGSGIFFNGLNNFGSGLYSDAAGTKMTFAAGSADRMTLDSSGNLGLGVTPSAWASGYRSLDVLSFGASLASSGAGATSTNLSHGAYFDGTNWIQKATDVTGARYQMLGSSSGSSHSWFIAPNSTAGNAISFSQVMTLDASGNLALGTTSFGSFSGTALGIYGAGTARFKLMNSTSGTASGDGAELSYTGTELAIENRESGTIVFYNGGTERARIDSSGNLLVNLTSTILAGNLAVKSGVTQNGGVFQTLASAGSYTAIAGSRNGNYGNVAEWWYDLSTQVGTIAVTASATAYNTSSDYRLKNTIAPMTGALAKVALLKPCTYKWNADGSDGEGFIAHELQAVVPQCVTGEKDAVDAEGKPQYQGIDTSFLVATLTAAIQEQQALINSLKARLDAANL